MTPTPASQLQPGDIVRFTEPLNAVVVAVTQDTDDLIRLTFAIHRLLTETVEVVR